MPEDSDFNPEADKVNPVKLPDITRDSDSSEEELILKKSRGRLKGSKNKVYKQLPKL